MSYSRSLYNTNRVNSLYLDFAPSNPLAKVTRIVICSMNVSIGYFHANPNQVYIPRTPKHHILHRFVSIIGFNATPVDMQYEGAVKL